MTPKEVAEASKLLQQLDTVNLNLEREIDTSKTFQLLTIHKHSSTWVNLSPRIREAAFRAWRLELFNQRAAIIRRLNQLNIEHGATNV